MAYIHSDREQTVCFRPSVEDYIPPNDPVRAYDAFVEQLDLKELGIVVDDNQVGPPGIRSTRHVKNSRVRHLLWNSHFPQIRARLPSQLKFHLAHRKP